MNTLAALLLSASASLVSAGFGPGHAQEIKPEAGRTSTQAQIHNIPSAHAITLGEGTKVGILDHSFGLDAHGDLYAGSVTFRTRSAGSGPVPETHQGYWMALALHEIAPATSIFALDLFAENESDRIQLISQALDWAVEHELDAVTYCAGGLSKEAREALAPILEGATAAGVVMVFVDYSHPMNISPGPLGASVENEAVSPDLQVFSYDCTSLMADQFLALVDPDDDEINRNRPFLTRPSIGSVTAGLVALVRSVDGEASPRKVKELLMETSRSLEFRGSREANVPDAFAAISRVVG
jgi:hypothetical protein